MGRLCHVAEDIAKSEPAQRRNVFRHWVNRIDLRFDKIQRGKRTECAIRSGEIHLRTEWDGIFGSVIRGDRTAIELFLVGVGGWESGLRRILVREPESDRP